MVVISFSQYAVPYVFRWSLLLFKAVEFVFSSKCVSLAHTDLVDILSLTLFIFLFEVNV